MSLCIAEKVLDTAVTISLSVERTTSAICRVQTEAGLQVRGQLTVISPTEGVTSLTS